MIKRRVIYEITVTPGRKAPEAVADSEGDIAAFNRAVQAVDFIHDTVVVYRVTDGGFVYESPVGEFGPAHVAKAYEEHVHEKRVIRLISGG